MNKDELKKWFCNKFNGCYKAKKRNGIQNVDDKNIFYFYDEQFARQKKLSRIVGEEIIYPSVVKGKCLFEQDTEDLLLYCDYTEIWSFFETNYLSTHIGLESEYKEIQSFIKEILMEDNMNIKYLSFKDFSYYTPDCDVINENFNDHDDFWVYLPGQPY